MVGWNFLACVFFADALVIHVVPGWVWFMIVLAIGVYDQQRGNRENENH